MCFYQFDGRDQVFQNNQKEAPGVVRSEISKHLQAYRHSCHAPDAQPFLPLY